MSELLALHWEAEGDQRASPLPSTVELTVCRLIHLGGAVQAPSGEMAKLAICMEGFSINRSTFYRLYVVEPEEVTCFLPAFDRARSSAFQTPIKRLRVVPLVMRRYQDPDGVAFTALLKGKQHSATLLVADLGLR